MFQDLKLTRSERHAIETAHAALYSHTRSIYELDHWTAQERKGYGHASGSVPLICAKALIVKWFLRGVQEPNALLRDAYALVPAAVYMQGLGAREAHEGRLSADTIATLRAGVDAWAAAFDRMHQRDMASLRAAVADAVA
jgi:hypothetical protein